MVNSNNIIACWTALDWSSWAWTWTTVIKVITKVQWINYSKILTPTRWSAKRWSAATAESRSYNCSRTSTTTWCYWTASTWCDRSTSAATSAATSSNWSTTKATSFFNNDPFLWTSTLNGMATEIVSFSDYYSFLRTSAGWSNNRTSTSWSFFNNNSFSLAWAAIGFLLGLFLNFSKSMNLGLGIFEVDGACKSNYSYSN